jgi:hypothetical protein
LKVAPRDYKYFYDKPARLPVHLDFWRRKQVLSVTDEDLWIRYMNHELISLSPQELAIRNPRSPTKRNTGHTEEKTAKPL